MVTGKCVLVLALATVSLAMTAPDMRAYEEQLADLQRQVAENQQLRKDILDKLVYLEGELEVEDEGKIFSFSF